MLPVTRVTEADDAALRDFPRRDEWEALVAETTAGAMGMPVAVQVVPPWPLKSF